MLQGLTKKQLNQRFTPAYIERSHDFITVVDKSIRIRHVTDSFARLCGFGQASDFIGLSNFDINCAAVKSAVEFEQQFRRVIERKRAMRILDIHTYANDSLWLHTSVKAPVYDENNEVIGAYIYCYDADDSYQLVAQQILKVFDKFHHSDVRSISLEVVLTYEQLNLTPCESLSFYFYIRGYTFKEIARYLKRSPRTIEEHIYNIKCKSGINSRSSLIEYAVVSQLFYLIPEVVFKYIENNGLS